MDNRRGGGRGTGPLGLGLEHWRGVGGRVGVDLVEGAVSAKGLVIWPLVFLVGAVVWAWMPGTETEPVQSSQTVEAPIPAPVVVRAMPVVPRPEMPPPGSAQVRGSFSIPLAPQHK